MKDKYKKLTRSECIEYKNCMRNTKCRIFIKTVDKNVDNALELALSLGINKIRALELIRLMVKMGCFE
jgi:hypothetical protein